MLSLTSSVTLSNRTRMHIHALPFKNMSMNIYLFIYLTCTFPLSITHVMHMGSWQITYPETFIYCLFVGLRLISILFIIHVMHMSEAQNMSRNIYYIYLLCNLFINYIFIFWHAYSCFFILLFIYLFLHACTFPFCSEYMYCANNIINYIYI